MRDRGYDRAPILALLALAVLLGIVIGGTLVAHRVDRELAAERWQWTEGD